MDNDQHHILIKNRENLDITGIKKIESLNSDEFILESSMGYITITGENLEMLNLNTNSGELSISGMVNEIKYHEKLGKINEKKENFFVKLFK